MEQMKSWDIYQKPHGNVACYKRSISNSSPPPQKMIYSITNDEQLPGLLENNKLIPTSGFIPKWNPIGSQI